jgi:hypothetical protein
VRQALSRLDDQVDPACQSMLDEHMNQYGTLTVGAAKKTPAETTADAREKAAADTEAPADSKPSDSKASRARPPKNLLAKLSPKLETPNDMPDVVVSADGPADAAETADGDTPAAGQGATDVAVASDQPAETELKPVKASLGTKAVPGHCENRWVCLPGTPKPTIMLMCPGKGGDKPASGVTAAAEASAAAQETAATPPAEGTPAEQETASLSTGDSDVATPAASDGSNAAAPAPEAASEPTAKTETAVAPEKTEAAAVADKPESEPDRRTIEGGGVADWNWSFDPTKQL